MKKTLSVVCISLLCSTSWMLAAEPTTYQQARAAYDSRQYQKALDSFQSIYLQHLQNIELNFLMGRSAFELKKYEVALSAYERALLAASDRPRVRLEYARTLFMLNMMQEARKEFETVLRDESLPENVRKNAQKFIDSIDNKRQKHAFNAIAILGIGYDDNIDNLTDITSFTLPLYNLELTRTSTKQKDISLSETGILLYNYDFGQKDGYSWDSILIAQNLNWDKRADKDTQYFAAITGPKYKSKKHTFNLPLSIERIWYGKEDLLSMYSFYPQYVYSGFDTWTLGSTFKYQLKRYSQDADEGKDSLYLEWEEKAGKKLNDTHSLEGALKYVTEKKDSGDLTSVDLNAYQFKASHTYTFSESLNLNSAYTYKKTNYTDTDSVYLEKRRDEYHNIAFTLTYLYDKKTSILFTPAWTDNRSNQAPNTYKKITGALNLMYVF